jgi:hypothetical protein
MRTASASGARIECGEGGGHHYRSSYVLLFVWLPLSLLRLQPESPRPTYMPRVSTLDQVTPAQASSSSWTSATRRSTPACKASRGGMSSVSEPASTFATCVLARCFTKGNLGFALKARCDSFMLHKSVHPRAVRGRDACERVDGEPQLKEVRRDRSTPASPGRSSGSGGLHERRAAQCSKA